MVGKPRAELVTQTLPKGLSVHEHSCAPNVMGSRNFSPNEAALFASVDWSSKSVTEPLIRYYSKCVAKHAHGSKSHFTLLCDPPMLGWMARNGPKQFSSLRTRSHRIRFKNNLL